MAVEPRKAWLNIGQAMWWARLEVRAGVAQKPGGLGQQKTEHEVHNPGRTAPQKGGELERRRQSHSRVTLMRLHLSQDRSPEPTGKGEK